MQIALDFLVVTLSARCNSNAKVLVVANKASNELVLKGKVCLKDVRDYCFLLRKVFKDTNPSLVK